MFIIPVGNRVDWKRPPVVTLLLILINCCVFFFLQGSDAASEQKAANYYFSSDLPNWELPRYATFLAQHADAAAQPFQDLLTEKNADALAIMESDAAFMRALHQGEIIDAQAAEFAAWQTQRAQFEAMASFTQRYVYRVAQASALTALTSAFMHGGFDHLLGNMVVLFLVGFLVESVIGKRLFLLAYLVAAYAAIAMFTLAAGTGSLLGASGAIAGVMGLYTVIFGLQKIDFFYSLGFYFDYIKAPAIALLPLWLGNELYQFFNNHGSHVAYMAHFGGLLCGAIIGALYRNFRPARIHAHHQEVTQQEQQQDDYKTGMNYLSAMEFAKAHQVFKALLTEHPNDLDLAKLCYRTAKHDSASADYHNAALRLLTMPAQSAHSTAQVHQIFHEYLAHAKPAPKLSADLLAQLAQRFADGGECEDAEKLVILLQRNAPQHGQIPAVLLALARTHYRAQRVERFKTVLTELIEKFPTSSQAATAQDMLRVAGSL